MHRLEHHSSTVVKLPQLLSKISITDKERKQSQDILDRLARRERSDLRSFFSTPVSPASELMFPEVRHTNEHMFKSIREQYALATLRSTPDLDTDEIVSIYEKDSKKKYNKQIPQDFNNWELSQVGRIKVRERKRRKQILSELASMKSYLPPPLKKPLTQNEKAMQESLRLLDQRRKQQSFLLQGNQAMAYYRAKPMY
mmetsp:Transcript_34113/g.59510  ORF Transcript_34113/g.59510 Transcript_34113/m.59510 type:complete len:198 (+) Transcript_34113:31-624(+)